MPRPAPPLLLPIALPWARALIDAGRAVGELPEYGSSEWAGLPDTDPRKVAACVLAAEVHRYEVATLAERTRVEIDAAAAEERRAFAEEADRLMAEVDAAAVWDTVAADVALRDLAEAAPNPYRERRPA